MNEQVISSGNKDVSFNPPELDTVLALCNELDATGSVPKDPATVESGLQLLTKAATKWPASSRLPSIDLLRLLATATPVIAEVLYQGQDVVTALQQSGVFEKPINGNNAMLAIRLFGNLFETPLGRELAVSKFDEIVRSVSSVTTAADSAPNRNITIAATTLYINYAVSFTTEGRAASAESAEHALQLLEQLTQIFSREKDSEAVYRGLVAVGTLVTVLGDEVKTAAREVYSLNSVLANILSTSAGREPRIKGVIAEIRKALP